jgi:hypothetical protein
MRPHGWVLQLGPPLLVVVAILAGSVAVPNRLIVGPATAASARSCPAGNFAEAVGGAPRKAPMSAQVEMRPRFGGRGEMAGQTLVLSVAGDSQRRIDLAAESFAAAPVSNVVVFGQNEPSLGSKVRAIDLETGCEFALFATDEAVRSATVDPGLRSLYVHSVGAADRADRGVRRVDVASGASKVVMLPIEAADRFGIAFATNLIWSLAGDELAVQSCGIEACRTRVLDTATGRVQSFADPPHGELVGLGAEKLFAFDVCPALPCALESVDRATGKVATIGVDAYSAELSQRAGRPVLVAETPNGAKEIRP